MNSGVEWILLVTFAISYTRSHSFCIPLYVLTLYVYYVFPLPLLRLLLPLSLYQIVGYAISLYGMNTYKDFKKAPDAVSARIFSAMRVVSCGIIRIGGNNNSDGERIASEPMLDDSEKGSNGVK